MKKSKILAPALAILCLSTAASVTGTVAWFAANNVVYANNLTVHANTQASLIISEAFPTTGNLTSVSFTDESLGLNAASRYNGTGEITGGILQTVSNGEAIDPATGLARDEDDPQHADLIYTAGAADQNWKDYVVYIASASKERVLGENEYLEASVAFTGANKTTYATSVDFHVELGAITTGLGDFKDTINAAGTVASENHGDFVEATGTKFQAELLTGVAESSPAIPVAGSTTEGLKITMRVYIDGALQDTETSAYVLTDNPNYDSITMNVTFSLKSHAGD